MEQQWLIEDGVFPENVTLEIKSTLDSLGLDYTIQSDPIGHLDSCSGLRLNSCSELGPSPCIIPYGSVGFISQFLENNNKCGGYNFPSKLWYDNKSLSFSNLSKNWGSYMLNDDYLVVSLGSFQKNVDGLFKMFGKVIAGGNALFMKPLENNKSFNGTILMHATAQDTLDNLINDNNYFDRVDSDTLIVISKPHIVLNEWRLFVLDNEIICCTQYNKKRQKHYEEGCPQAVRDFANKVISKWGPDTGYSLDICETHDGYKVVEAGCLNCSDLYASNKSNFFTKVSKQGAKNE